MLDRAASWNGLRSGAGFIVIETGFVVIIKRLSPRRSVSNQGVRQKIRPGRIRCSVTAAGSRCMFKGGRSRTTTTSLSDCVVDVSAPATRARLGIKAVHHPYGSD